MVDIDRVGPGSAGRRERILVAAETEFAARGVDGARIDRIAAAAGVNKQLLFHYFRSKAGLYQAAAAAASARHDPGSAGGATLAERLRNLADLVLVAAQTSARLLTPDWRSRAGAQARKVFTDGQRQGYVRDDIDPAQLSELLVSACLGWVPATAAAEPGPEARHHFRDSVVAVLADFCVWR
jgi:AcrR family transcriptional regulator